MWQKFLYFVFTIIISSLPNFVYAQTVEVSAIESFSTANPPKMISIKLLEPLYVSEKTSFIAGTVLQGDLVDVVSPKRLKQDASFSFKLVSYMDSSGAYHKVPLNIVAKYIVPLDKVELAKDTALVVGNYFVKGLSIGASAVSGAVENKEGNCVKSSAKSVYEASPFSLVEKGGEIDIKSNQKFYLAFPDVQDVEDSNNSINGKNYSFKIEKE